MNRLTQTMKKRKGFTLVELIIVIVIILVLAAVAVPLLLNYIGQAKLAKNIEEAKTCMTVTQGEMINAYANNIVIADVPGTTLGSGTKDKDVDLRNTDIAKNIMNSLGANPYMLILGMGSTEDYGQSNPDRLYTVYFAAYWADKNDDPIFYNGTEWTTEYPWGERQHGYVHNELLINGNEKVRLRFYLVASPAGVTGAGNCWNLLQDKLGIKY